jgi:hypothetical protein
LQEREHATFFQPFAHFVQGMMPLENGEDEGFDLTPTREAMRRVRRDEAVNHCCHLHAP